MVGVQQIDRVVEVVEETLKGKLPGPQAKISLRVYTRFTLNTCIQTSFHTGSYILTSHFTTC